MENINEQFKRLFCELDLTDDQAAMIKKLQRDVDAALHQTPVSGRSEQFIFLIEELINVGIIDEDDIEVETWVKNYIKEINCH